MKQNLKMRGLLSCHANNGKTIIDYEHYQFGRKELILYGMESMGIVLLFAYFFYQSLFAVIPLIPVGFFFLVRKRKKLSQKQQITLKLQFKEAILSISAAMRAGYSAENAIRESNKDMERMFGANSLICKELHYMIGGMQNNIPVERLMQTFGYRSKVDEIKEFGDIFAISKKNGGNMVQVISETAEIISRKLEIDKEIETLIGAKKLEQTIMNLVPFFILMYVNITSKGFFQVLYHNAAGNIIMTIGVVIYLGTVMLEDKIMEIHI